MKRQPKISTTLEDTRDFPQCIVYFHVGKRDPRKHEVEILIPEGKVFSSSAHELDVGRNKATPRLNRFYVAIHSICFGITWKLGGKQ